MYNSDFIDVVGAGACQNLRVIVKRLRLLYLAPQREVARLEGEHISAIARTTMEIGETRLQIIQLERAFKEQVVTDLRAVADELVDLRERRIAAQHTFDHIEIRAPANGTVPGFMRARSGIA